jgi:VWFA-related protein
MQVRFAISLLFFCLPLAAQTVFHSGTTLVQVDAQVIKDHRPVEGLTAADFVLRENGTIRPIETLAYETEPLDVVLLLDTSGSMRKTIAELADGAKTALEQLHSQDRAALMVFSESSKVVQPLTEDRKPILASLASITSVSGETDLYGAASSAASYLQEFGRSEGRRAVLMVSDNLGPKTRPEQIVVSRFWMANAVFNDLVTPTPFDASLLPPEWRPSKKSIADMGAISAATGGETVLLDGNAAAGLGRMLERARQRYSLYYKPAPGRAGEERTITLELTKPIRKRVGKVEIRARKGYVLREDVGE